MRTEARRFRQVTTDYLGQAAHQVRLEWGPEGAAALAADALIVVDVLSFSTAVCVAVERGMSVLPFPMRGAEAAAFARQRRAVLAAGRTHSAVTDPPSPSLSPASLRDCDLVPRLVLPSPNGSTIAQAHAATGGQVAAGCLRNAGAVAHWAAARLNGGSTVAVVPAGERWPAPDGTHDGPLRPAIEDLLGAGAILWHLARLTSGTRPVTRFSPEATLSAEAFAAAQPLLEDRLLACVSGQELIQRGFAADVAIAAELDVSTVVPVLKGEAFESASDAAYGGGVVPRDRVADDIVGGGQGLAAVFEPIAGQP